MGTPAAESALLEVYIMLSRVCAVAARSHMSGAKAVRCAAVPLTRTFWSHVEEGPPDAILGLSQAFLKDTAERKVNLGVGAYRDDNGKPYVLDAVREAEKRILGQNLEYLPIAGFQPFLDQATKLVFGDDCSALKEGRNVTVQSLSGTGALRVAGEFLNKFLPNRQILFPTPTWANHNSVFQNAGLKIGQYRYYDPSTCGLDFDGMAEDIDRAEDTKPLRVVRLCLPRIRVGRLRPRCTSSAVLCKRRP